MRPPWHSLPPSVRTAVEELLGFSVLAAESASEGFSPGVAASVRGADGQRAFVKAVSATVNARSPELHRTEAVITRQLPASLRAPALLGVHDDGTWVALAFEYVAGRVPARPWVAAELDAAVDALDRLAVVPAPPGLPAAQDELADEFGGWARLQGAATELSGWELRLLDRLVELEAGWPAAVEGDRLLHLDARADNMLMTADGHAVLLDWPWAAAGAPVLDVVGFVPDAVLRGAPSAEALLQRTVAGRDAPAHQVDVLVCAFAGLMAEAHRSPPAPAMERLREFQRAQAKVSLAWLRRRTGW